jgi:hypothetical protein
VAYTLHSPYTLHSNELVLAGFAVLHLLFQSLQHFVSDQNKPRQSRYTALGWNLINQKRSNLIRNTLSVASAPSPPSPRLSQRVQHCATVVACMSVAWLSAGSALAAETLDQSNAPVSWGGAAHHVTTRAEQTVSPTLTCLTRVEIGLMTGNRGRGGDLVTLRILDWSNLRNPKQLATIDASVQDGFDGFLSFPMPGSGIEVPRNWLALQVESRKNIFWWKYQFGDPYPGGLYFFGGYGDTTLDYLFKTYGHSGNCKKFSLTVTPNPISLAQGGSSTATIGVNRQPGFTDSVNVQFALPSGVTSSPSTFAIKGATEKSTLSANANAPTGKFSATVYGTESGGTSPTPTSFPVNVTPAALAQPKVTSVTPTLQQRGGTITVKGSGFDLNCSLNDVDFAGVKVEANSSCVPGALTVTVPTQALYGSTTLKVISKGVTSNGIPFSVGRQVGSFSEITSDVLFRTTTRPCEGGTKDVVVSKGVPSLPSGKQYVASYTPVPRNPSDTFQSDFSYLDTFPRNSKRYIISGIGGAGFSLCSVGLVFDGGNGGSARLFLRDLETGALFRGSPYSVAIRVPRLNKPYAQNYHPRFFRSPDGTIILVVTAAAESGTGHLTATFYDTVTRAELSNLPVSKPANSDTIGNPAISAMLGADNRITLTVGKVTLASITIP